MANNSDSGTSFAVVMENHKTATQCESPLNFDYKLLYMKLVFGLISWMYETIVHYSLVIQLVVISVIVLFLLYRSYVNPEVYTKELTDVGFDHIPAGPDRAASIARAQSSRRLGIKIPPPYPNGWFSVAESRDLKTGGVLAVDALGQNLCVYRGEDGAARCVDAYCPHLGAHLGIEGTVCGNCIECPFHKWRFDADGTLVDIPGLDTVPKGVSIKTWTTVEAEGSIWIWHDAEGRPPLYDLKEPPEIATGGFGYRGHNLFNVNCHIQEIPENGADVAHLNAVHASSALTRIAEKYPWLETFIGCHLWTAEWSKGGPSGDHEASIKMTQVYKFMKMEFFHCDLKVTQIGPGHVHLRMNTPLGPVLMLQSVTPIAPLTQRIVHRMYTPAYNAILGAVSNRLEAYQFMRDITIWNSKRYVGTPVYVRLDKSIRAFRTWYQQFYSEHSLSFADANNSKSLDW